VTLLNDKADFIATLTYRTTEQGGRKTPVFKTGYHPQIKFPFSEMQTSGQQTFIDKDIVFPGDTVTAEIQIIAVDHFANQLAEGMNFEFREGSTVIGVGTIGEIINENKGVLPGGPRASGSAFVMGNSVYYGLGYDFMDENLNTNRKKDWRVLNLDTGFGRQLWAVLTNQTLTKDFKCSCKFTQNRPGLQVKEAGSIWSYFI